MAFLDDPALTVHGLPSFVTVRVPHWKEPAAMSATWSKVYLPYSLGAYEYVFRYARETEAGRVVLLILGRALRARRLRLPYLISSYWKRIME